MNKRYEEGRKPFFSNEGENEQKQYVWAKDENGKEYLQETAHRHTQTKIQKGGMKMALVSLKDIKQAIAVMREILEKLDKIYHALHNKS